MSYSVVWHPLVALSFFVGTTAWAASAPAPTLEAHGTLSSADIPYHHTANYTIEMIGPAESEVEVGPWAASMPGLQIERLEPMKRVDEGGKQHVTQVFRLSPYYAATFTLPPIIILADGEVVHRLAMVEFVARDLTAEELAAAEVMVPPFSRADLMDTVSRWPLGLALLVLGALIVGGAVFWLLRRKPHREYLSPWERADADLVHLAGLLERRGVRGEAFYATLSNILRDYVAQRYGIAVRERSTFELARSLAEETPLDEATQTTLLAHLRQIDGVKYAQRRPTASEMASEIAGVRAFVMATIPGSALDESASPSEEHAV